MASPSFFISSRSWSRSLLSLIFLLAACPAHSAITVLDYWRMGENDSFAQPGSVCVVTTDIVRSKTLTNAFAGGTYPLFTSDVSAAAAAETGSSLSLAYTNSQYGTATVATNLTDNFGLECWVKPGTNSSGGHVLAHNGLRGNGWGLYQNGGNFQVLYGGQIFFGNAPATPNTWTHLALVRSGGVAILYTNGVPAATNSANIPIPPSGSFTVCGNASFSEFFTGKIDEVRVFTFAAGAFSTNDLLLNASKVIVYSANDSGPGTLRNAVANASSGTLINFGSAMAGQVIKLTNGQITLSNSVTIDASAVGGVLINGNGSSGMLLVNGGVSAILNSLTFLNGYALDGGAISINVFGALSVSNCGFLNNNGYDGGAIFNRGTLNVNNSSFTGNQGSDQGGAIYNDNNSTSFFNNCTFNNNQTGGEGGAISSLFSLMVSNSTFSGNQAVAGGALYIQSSGTLNNCTLTGNQTFSNPFIEGGGGIFLSTATATVNSCTISGNQANFSGGGGLFSTNSTLHLTNCIVAGNFPDDSPSGDHCLVNTSAALLAPLGSYGGPTLTMPPLPGSPAIDLGLDAITNSFVTDQRGCIRKFGAHVDIGAVESGGLWITNLSDTNAGSLRKVVADVTTNSIPKTVLFVPSLSGQTITLTGGQILLSNNITIDASALTNGIQISGNGSSVIFLVNGGSSVMMNGLALTHGFGGAVNNFGTLALSNCTLTANSAGPTGVGGAIYNTSSLSVNHCTIANNLANNNSFGGGGGGIYNSGSLALNNSTLAGNQANNDINGGGGIANSGALVVNNSTISLNQALGNSGGGILNNGTAFLTNSIIAGNFPDDSPGGYYCVINTSPGLAPLGNYGGPTQTMPPLPGSPAIDAATATFFTTDQRGYARVVGQAGDIGAAEGVYNPAGLEKLITTYTNGLFMLAFTNYTDQSFSVSAATNLNPSSTNWTRIGSAIETTSGSGKFQFIDMNAANFTQRFYRISSP